MNKSGERSSGYDPAARASSPACLSSDHLRKKLLPADYRECFFPLSREPWFYFQINESIDILFSNKGIFHLFITPLTILPLNRWQLPVDRESLDRPMEMSIHELESRVEGCRMDKTMSGVDIYSHRACTGYGYRNLSIYSDFFPFYWEIMPFSIFISIIRCFFRINFHYRHLPVLPTVFSFTHESMSWYQPTGRNQTLDMNQAMAASAIEIGDDFRNNTDNGNKSFQLKCRKPVIDYYFPI